MYSLNIGKTHAKVGRVEDKGNGKKNASSTYSDHTHKNFAYVCKIILFLMTEILCHCLLCNFKVFYTCTVQVYYTECIHAASLRSAPVSL